MRTFFVVCVLLLFSFMPAQADGYQSSKFMDISETYGFLSGQQYALDFIRQEFPELKLEVKRVELGFNRVFGNAKERLEEDFKKFAGDQFLDLKAGMDKQIRQNIKYDNIVVTQQALKEIDARAIGGIPSPVLETLLVYNYQNNPAKEFSDGFKNEFNTSGHKKAKGLELELQYPRSWKAKEARRPNIIQIIKNDNGRGSVIAMMTVRDLVQEGGDELSQGEKEAFKTIEGCNYLAEDLFSKETLTYMAVGSGMNNVREVSSKRIVIDKWPAVELVFKGEQKRLDLTFSTYNQYYMVLYKNYIVSLNFQFAKLPDEDEGEFVQEISRYEPLLKLMTNSFIIQSQY